MLFIIRSIIVLMMITTPAQSGQSRLIEGDGGKELYLNIKKQLDMVLVSCQHMNDIYEFEIGLVPSLDLHSNDAINKYIHKYQSKKTTMTVCIDDKCQMSVSDISDYFGGPTGSVKITQESIKSGGNLSISLANGLKYSWHGKLIDEFKKICRK